MQTCTLLRRAVNAARKEQDRLAARRQQPHFPHSLLHNGAAAAADALEAVAAQLDGVRALRERHNAEQQLGVLRHNLVRVHVRLVMIEGVSEQGPD